MSEKFIKKTQDTLGKVIKKPPLTEKLLGKPPFRFLHDIITSVIKTTGFMKGLFAESEMSSENVKDSKETKIAFLQKAIDMVSLVIGKPVAARPSKVVAGHEPEKTNEFLQMLAEAINKKVDNAEYVERVLKGDAGGGGGGGKKDKEKPPTGSREKREGSADRRKRKEKDEDGERGHRSKDKDKDREERKDRGKSRDRERDKDRDKDRDRERSKDRSRDRDGEKERRHRNRDRSRDKGEDKDREKDRDKDREKDKDKDRERRKRRDREASETEEGETQQVNGDASEEKVRKKPTSKASPKMSPKLSPSLGGRGKERPSAKSKSSGANPKLPPSPKMPPRGGQKEVPVRLPRPSSAKGSRRRHKDGRRRGNPEVDKAEEDEEAVKEERPSKKREETTMNGHVGEEDPPPPPVENRGRSRMARPSSARPAPPRVKKNEIEPQEVHIVGQSNAPHVIVDKKGDDSDDDDDFITKEDDVPIPIDEPPPPPATYEEEDGGDHGGLVKKILETKKELEGGSTTQQGKAKKTEIERSHMTDATKRKEREMVQKEIDKLRAAIQLLTRSANPLGKIMDFVQEDLDSMQKELEMWVRENKDNVVALQREERITESSIEPLKAQLTELDAAINDQLDVIAAVKANIIRNDDKIEKMLSTTTKS